MFCQVWTDILTGLLQIYKSGCCLPAGLIIIRLNTLDLLTKQMIVKHSPLWSKLYLGLSFLCQPCQLNFLAILEAAVKDVKHNSILAPTPSLKTGKNADSCFNLVMVWSIMTMLTMLTMVTMLMMVRSTTSWPQVESSRINNSAERQSSDTAILRPSQCFHSASSIFSFAFHPDPLYVFT